jgi:hypothetical protein
MGFAEPLLVFDRDFFADCVRRELNAYRLAGGNAVD